MLLNKTNYNSLENVGVVLADDICTMANHNVVVSTNLSANANYLSMDYIGFFKNNQHIAHLMNLKAVKNALLYHKKAVNQKQLLALIEQAIGKVILSKHAKTMHVENQSLF